MKSQRRKTVFTGLLFAAALMAAAAHAQGKSLAHQLVGQWQLVSVSINNAAPYGDQPTGSMLLDAAGHYAVVVISAGDAKNVAYYGTYAVDEASSTVTMHIAGSTRGRAEGRDQKHTMTVNGDQLVDDRTIGRKGSIRMTWKRTS